ncbi:MAG: peptidoglycan-binding domain-containing protein [Candidatus Heimdallarchaeaceae archaeon]
MEQAGLISRFLTYYECSIDFLELNSQQDGEIFLEDFGDNWTNLTLIPSIQSKISGFTDSEHSYDFSLSISAEIENKEDEELIKQLEARIAELQKQIAEITAKINAILGNGNPYQRISQNLYFGMQNQQVSYLQEFLKKQGQGIYPEGLVTGYFGVLTKNAVIRFQNKYAKEILYPLDLTSGTGFVGLSTRTKINQLIGNN